MHSLTVPKTETTWIAESADLQQRWYALQTFARSERKVVEQLQRKAIQTFLPTSREQRTWSDRRVSVDAPMLPGYAFVHAVLIPQTRLHILQTHGVRDFVSFGGEIPVIPDQQIEELRLLTTNRIRCAEVPYLRTGERVRVRGGCLEGLQGILLSRPSDKTLVISLDSISRSIAIPVGDYKLEKVHDWQGNESLQGATRNAPGRVGKGVIS